MREARQTKEIIRKKETGVLVNKSTIIASKDAKTDEVF